MEVLSNDNAQDGGKLTDSGNSFGVIWLTVTGAGALVGLLIGIFDGYFTNQLYTDFNQNEHLSGYLFLYSAAFLGGFYGFWGLIAGFAWAVVPFEPGPIVLTGWLYRFWNSKDENRASLAASAWSVLLTLSMALVVLIPLGYHFITSYHNQLLAAAAQSVCLLVLILLLPALRVTLAHYIRIFLGRSGAVGRILRLSAGPRALVIIVVAIGIGLGVYIPLRFSETWEALPFRTPVWILAGVLFWWVLSDLMLRMALRWSVVVALLSIFGVITSGAITSSVFENKPEDSEVAYAISEYGAIIQVVYAKISARYDGDGDGYPGRFGGGDCDDSDSEINPEQIEVPNNGIDENCSGEDLIVDLKAMEDVLKIPEVVLPPKPELRKQWNVLFILVDAVRWNRVGWAGYERELTPNLDRLAKNSIRFQAAYSPSNKTPSTMPSLMTGRYISELHRTYAHFSKLYSDNPFIAEAFKQAGYVTMASMSHYYCKKSYGFAEGFDEWQVVYKGTTEKMEKMVTAPIISDRIIDMLDRYRAGELGSRDEQGKLQPFYLMTYYLDPHKHYLEHKGFKPFGKKSSDRYDGEIRFTDHHIGRVLDYLETHDLLSNTIIVMTSDHGEAFGEHGMRYHGWDLLEHQIRVPLMIYVPGLDSAEVTNRVSLMDISPTLFDLTLTPPTEGTQGVSLVPYMLSEGPLKARLIYSEMPKGPYNEIYRAVIYGDLKLIHRLRGNKFRLFDLKEDPGELKNLMKERPEDAKRMRSLYESFMATAIELQPAVQKKK